MRVLELRVPDARMSHAHARIVRAGSDFVFEDLGSTNGSRVGRAAARSAVRLVDGHVIEIGRTFLRFRSALPTPPGADADRDFEVFRGTVDSAFATLLPELWAHHEALIKVATTRVPVLVTGETGTGKELIARALHQASRRAGPLVAVNCGAIPQGLVEGQLFGHTRGAFSGASHDHAGVVRSADRGTLFLDEIGDLPPAAQPALLRVLQEGEVVAVGGAGPQRVDLRVVSATHSDLESAISRGTFRADLFARIAGARHVTTPLRERIEDLGVLVAATLERVAPERAGTVTFAAEAVRALLSHPWPMNVRELHTQLSLALAFAGESPVGVEHLPRGRASGATDSQRTGGGDEMLRALLLDELGRARGNVSAVARTMGTARMQVHRWMKRFHIDPRSFRYS